MCSQNERIPSNVVCKFESSHSAVSAARVGREWRHTRKQTKSRANKRGSQIPSSACKRVHKSLGDEVAVAPSRPLRSASLPLIRATLHPLVQDDLTARVKHPLAEEPQRAQSGGRETDCVAGLVGLELANVGLKIAI